MLIIVKLLRPSNSQGQIIYWNLSLYLCVNFHDADVVDELPCVMLLKVGQQSDSRDWETWQQFVAIHVRTYKQ